jgi:cation:H+ antiporter
VWHFVLLIVCAGAIYLACEWFVNAVEWLGRRLNVGQMAVGSILAAFGTALPESVVTLVAVTTGTTPEQKDIGVGAAMGGPLALATVAYAATGMALLIKRRKDHHAQTTIALHSRAGAGRNADPVEESARAGLAHVLTDPAQIARLAKDQRWFLAVFVVKVTLGLVAFAFKPTLGLLFFAAYAVYFWREMRGGDDGGAQPEQEDLEPLKLQPKTKSPATWAVVTQTVATLAVIFVSSRVFVSQLDAIGPMLGLSAAVTALLLSPIATELPETMNAIIWVRQGKTKLALANISGAMMIQATVPSALGIFFTPWLFDGPLLAAGVATMASVLYLLWLFRTGRVTPARLTVAAAFYAAFAVALVGLLR